MSPGQAKGWTLAEHHLARYEWALPGCDGLRVAELGCGLGYGSDLLSWSSEVVGVDLDGEAIEFARRTYGRPSFLTADITDPDQLPNADVAVCFEVIEHVNEPRAVLTGALDRYERLLLSVPNPLAAGSHVNPHHRNDWPPTTLWAALRRAGARRVRWYRQGLYSAGRRGALPGPGVWLAEAETLGPCAQWLDRSGGRGSTPRRVGVVDLDLIIAARVGDVDGRRVALVRHDLGSVARSGIDRTRLLGELL